MVDSPQLKSQLPLFPRGKVSIPLSGGYRIMKTLEAVKINELTCSDPDHDQAQQLARSRDTLLKGVK